MNRTNKSGRGLLEIADLTGSWFLVLGGLNYALMLLGEGLFTTTPMRTTGYCLFAVAAVIRIIAMYSNRRRPS